MTSRAEISNSIKQKTNTTGKRSTNKKPNNATVVTSAKQAANKNKTGHKATMKNIATKSKNVKPRSITTTKQGVTTKQSKKADAAGSMPTPANTDIGLQLWETTDEMTRAINDMLEHSSNQISACQAYGNMATNTARELVDEMLHYSNKTFSDNMEISKDIFSCRTINDLFDLHNKLMHNNIDNFFNKSIRITQLLLQHAGDAVEPFNQAMADSAKKIKKLTG